MPALAGAGVASVKLEGRLKRPEYVAVTAASYRKAIDSLENGHFAKAGADERLALRQMFNRGDFMRGYAMGAEDAAVIYPQRVNHLGVPLGKIERVERGFARFTPLLALHDGDGLQLRAEGAPDQDMIYSGKEIPAGQEALLRLRLQGAFQWHGDDDPVSVETCSCARTYSQCGIPGRVRSS